MAATTLEQQYLAGILAQVTRLNNGGGTGGFGGGGGGGLGASTKMSDIIKSVTPDFATLKQALNNNIDTWRSLTKVGASFSNDIVRMSAAAGEARVTLSEFATLINSNAKTFASLGANVNRGVEAFSKLTKEFQDTDFAKQLTHMGYTTAEANDLLALQVGFMRHRFNLDKESNQAQLESVMKLGESMALLSSTTNLTVEQQKLLLKEGADNAALQAKFKLIELTQGKDAADLARETYKAKLTEYEAMGQGNVFKEKFIRGYISSEAAIMESVTGGAATAIAQRDASSLAIGKALKASESTDQARAIQIKNMNNPAALQLATQAGTSPVGDAYAKNFKSNEVLINSVDRITTANGKLAVTQEDYLKIITQIRDDAKKGIKGVRPNAQGKDETVDQVLRGAIDAQNLYKDAAASVAGILEKTLNPALKQLGTTASNVADAINQSTGAGNLRAATERELGKMGSGKPEGLMVEAFELTEKIAKEAALAVNEVGEKFISLLGSSTIKVEVTKLPPAPTGPEYVLNDELGERFVKSAVSKLPNPTLDTGAIGDSIKTTFSSMSGGGSTTTNRRVQTDESAEYEGKLKNLSQEMAAFQQNAVAEMKAAMGEGTSTAKAAVAVTKDPEYQEKMDQYTDLINEWQRKVDQGVKYEIEKKEEAFTRTTQIVEQESALITSSIGDIGKKTSAAATEYFNEMGSGVEQFTKDAASSLEKKINLDLDEQNTEKPFPFPDIGKMIQGMVDSTGIKDAASKIEKLPQSILNQQSAKPIEDNVMNQLLHDLAETNGATNTNQNKEELDRQRTAEEKRKETKTAKEEPKKIPSMNNMIQDLAKASGIKDINKIQTGQKIKLPDNTEYIVKQGDTLSKIAQQTIKDMKSTVAAPGEKNTNQAKQSTSEAGRVSEDTAKENSEARRKAAEQAKENAQSSKKPTQEPATTQKTATLDDVIKSLDMLNKTMNQFITVSQEIGKKQVSAMRSSSENLFERYMP